MVLVKYILDFILCFVFSWDFYTMALSYKESNPVMSAGYRCLSVINGFAMVLCLIQVALTL